MTTRGARDEGRKCSSFTLRAQDLMNKDRSCDGRGLLVDGDHRLPADLCEYFNESVGVPVGCNRLRCSRCEAWVHGGPPGLTLRPDLLPDTTALYASNRWLDLPFIVRRRPTASIERKVRLYACR